MYENQPKNEYEKVPHTRINNINFFLSSLTYRTPHAHRDFEILQVIEGNLHVKTLAEDFSIGPGEIALFNPDTFHMLYSMQSHCIVLAIQADPAFCAAHYPSIRHIRFDTANITSITPFEEALKMIRVCLNLGYNYCLNDKGFELRCMSDLYRLFSYLIMFVPYHLENEANVFHSREKEKRFTRIINYIHRHYTEKITLSSLAESENLSMTYLSHLFKDAANMSFQEYLNSLRFEHALLLLKKTDRSITDICLESGFSDSKYLNKRLKSVYNLSLKDFRNTDTPPGRKVADNCDKQFFYPPEEGLEILRKHYHFECDIKNTPNISQNQKGTYM
ncbi:MAG: AraC family transcriptional regulator [Lachnospiraceae bacterium]|nr:AraC family transcriptional regulator [Lachnospiraceae bacterium]